MINGLVYYKRIHDVLPYIKDNYIITTAGEIFSDSAKFNHIEQPLSLHQDNWGYLQVRLMSTDGIMKSFTVHRLVMKVFCPIENDHLYQVNHRDGNKSNNNIWNLEWCTPSQNLHHAYDNNLREIIVGEDRINSTINNEQAEFICQRLDEGIEYRQIIELLYNLPYPIPDGIRNIIYKIHHRQAWTWISKNYKFEKEIKNTNYLLSIPEVHRICQLFEQGIFDYRIILEELGYNLNDLTENEIKRYGKAFYGIRSGDTYVEISSQYNFEKSNKFSVFTLEQREKIKEFYQKNIDASYKEVIEYIGIDYDELTRKEKNRYMGSILKIKNLLNK